MVFAEYVVRIFSRKDISNEYTRTSKIYPNERDLFGSVLR